MDNAYHQKLLQWGLQDGKMVYISDVQNGENCNCKCPKCGENLIARNNGKRNQHHFAHVSGSNCAGAVETALHRVVKEIFLATKSIMVPPCYGEGPNGFDKFIDAKLVTFDEIELEKRIVLGEQTIIPDAIGYVQGKRIFIEFAYAHFIDDAKRELLIINKIPCIEVDLRNTGQSLDSIKRLLTQETSSKKWIYNPKLDDAINLAYKIAEKEEAERRAKEEAYRLDADRRLKEYIQKVEQFEQQQKQELLKQGNLYDTCPVKKEICQGFLNSKYGSHPIVRQLASSKEWTQEVYGREGELIDTFIGSKQIIIVPANYKQLHKAEQDKHYRTLDAVIRYRDLLRNLNTSPCRFCNLFIQTVNMHIHCKYKPGTPVAKFYRYDKVQW